MKNKYDDIINLPHHVSSVHPRMARIDRAAQFAPFAALTGHNEAIKETARVVSNRVELDEEMKLIISNRLNYLNLFIKEQPVIKLTYFKEDGKKAGGAYVTIISGVKKLDEYTNVLVLVDGEVVAIDDIYRLESDLFNDLEV